MPRPPAPRVTDAPTPTVVGASGIAHPAPTRWAFTFGLAALACTSACVTVTPAQRELLSRPEMTPAADAHEEIFHSHIEAAREAGFGGHGAAGGGCGCG